jgi:hypothetical protein
MDAGVIPLFADPRLLEIALCVVVIVLLRWIAFMH